MIDRIFSFNFDEEKYIAHTLETDKILEIANFIAVHRFPRIMPLIEETVQKIMGESKPTLILFLKSEGRILDTFKKIVEEYPKLNVIYKNFENKEHEEATDKLLEIIGIRKREAPVLVLLPFVTPEKGIIPKYKTSRLTKKNIKSFIDSGLKGELDFYLKSEEEVQDKERKYRQVTLENFDDVVLKPNKFFILGIDIFYEQKHAKS